MRFKDRFRIIQRSDKVLLSPLPPRVLNYGPLETRILADTTDTMIRLLVNVSRKFGSAPERNQFKRRVRHAFLGALKEHPTQSSWIIWVRPPRVATTTPPSYTEYKQHFVTLFHHLESQ